MDELENGRERLSFEEVEKARERRASPPATGPPSRLEFSRPYPHLHVTADASPSPAERERESAKRGLWGRATACVHSLTSRNSAAFFSTAVWLWGIGTGTGLDRSESIMVAFSRWMPCLPAAAGAARRRSAPARSAAAAADERVRGGA